MVSYKIESVVKSVRVSSLNPCCSGQWSRTDVNHSAMTASQIEGLNPCCSGQWSRTGSSNMNLRNAMAVLILVVVDNGLVPVLFLPLMGRNT